MTGLKKSDIIKKTIQYVYIVASRRTTSRFADDTIKSSIKTLKKKYGFFSTISIFNEVPEELEQYVSLSSDAVEKEESDYIGKAIEAFIRIVYDELSEEAGLFFITEFKEYAGEQITQAIQKCGVDLDQIQLEQHHAYERRMQKKKVKDGGTGENLLGYSWEKVTSWQHEPGSKFCTLYDEQGNVLDRLNLDNIIQNYVETLSGETTTDPEKLEKEVRIYETEYNLLKLMFEGDMDADAAMDILKINKDELGQIIKKLTNMEMVHYVSSDTLELTESGMDYVSSSEKQ